MTPAESTPPQRGRLAGVPDQHGSSSSSRPRDLRQRLEVLPQSYLNERKVTERLRLARPRRAASRQLLEARVERPSRRRCGPRRTTSARCTRASTGPPTARSRPGRNQVFAVAGRGRRTRAVLLARHADQRTRPGGRRAVRRACEFPDPADLGFARGRAGRHHGRRA